MTIVLDIETGPLPTDRREFTRPDPETFSYGAAKKEDTRLAKFAAGVEAWETGDRCALDAKTGRVILCGFCDITRGRREYATLFADTDSAEDERGMLNNAFEILDKADVTVGHNVRNFDLRFMVRRAFAVGVVPPPRIIKALVSRYDPSIVDTMELYALGDYKSFVSLTHLCGYLGIELPKQDMHGKDFAKVWETDRDKCIEYNKDDLRATADAYSRLTYQPDRVE